MRTLRIFISSPSDVRAERVRAYDVVQVLQTKFRAFIQIETVLWEHEPMRATASFQAQIPKPSESDVVICVLWAKIGTRLPEDYRRPDGTVPTGTEWEFEDAFNAYLLRGTPDLLVYRKTAAPEIKVTSNEMLEEWLRQKKALDAVLSRWFQDHEGAFQAAFNTFADDDEFERMLTTHLEKIINVRLDKPVPIRWTEGSPFRGLEVFQVHHRDIFYGRDLAVAEVTGRLLAQSTKGRVFLLVLGMSGCGKSSLVRAGVLPELMRPGVAPAVGCWRWAVLRPSEASGTLVERLAAALTGDRNALPELAELGYGEAQLAALLADAPAHAIPLLEAALARAALRFSQDTLRERAPEARLILVVDQLEEMFTLERFDERQRSAFLDALSAFSRSGLVWVVATMRADLYAHCSGIESLRALKGEDGQYDLAAPGVSEIGQIIRMPALAAGLEFETHPTTHQKLDDALQQEAAGNPEALPLLEFCLDELYKLRSEDHLVTWEAYGQLGGLCGAIARRAEDTFQSLSAQAQAAFPQVLAALVSMEETAASHPALRAEMDRDPCRAEAVDAFAEAHLFVLDVNQAGAPVVAVAHEALLASWPRVQEWLQENRDFLRLKTRIVQAARRWRESGQDEDFLLPEGKPLAEAEDALARRPEQLDELEFVRTSIRRAKRRRRRRQWGVAAALTLVALAASGAVFARQRLRQQAASEVDFATAVGKLDEDQIPASLAYLADAMDKNPANAKAIALAVAELRDFPMPAQVLRHPDQLQDVAFSPDGARLVTACADGAARVWDAGTGAEVGEPMRQERWIHTAEFSADGSEVLTSGYDGTARLWDARTGKPLLAALGRVGGSMLYDAHLSRDGRRVVTAANDGTARIWDAATGAPVGEPMRHGHDRAVWTASFNPAGTLVVTASADHTARVWDAATGRPASASGRPAVLEHADEVNCAAFSPDGRWIVTASDDGTARLWDARTFLAVGQPMRHQAQVNFACFSPDSRFVVTASSDKTARVWSVPGGSPVGEPMRHDGWVRSATFSPDGGKVVTAAYDGTARVWDAGTGAPLAEPMRHGGAVYMAWFSCDGALVATASFDHTVRIWKWRGRRSRPVMKQPGALKAAMFAPDGRRLATVSGAAVQLWDPETGLAAGPAMVPGTGLLGAEFSAGGQWLLTFTGQGAQVWDTRTGQGRPPMPEPGLVGAAFSPDGRQVLLVAGHEVLLRDTLSGQTRVGPIRQEEAASGGCFSPDGLRLAVWNHEGSVTLLDAGTGARLGSGPMQHNGVVNRVRFSPDGQWLVTASADHTARVWNARTGAAAGPPMKHDSWVLDAAFSADGRWIVTASADQTAQVWDARTGQPVGQQLRHRQAVTSAGFSPDGRWVVTVAADGTAQVWDARSGFPMGRALVRQGRIVSACFSPDSRRLLTGSDDGTARIWDAPITAEAAPGWLPELAQALGGWRLDAHGVLQPADRDLGDLQRRLEHLAGTGPLAGFGRWLAADPTIRPPVPDP